MVTTSYESNGRGPDTGRDGRSPLDPLQKSAQAALEDVREQGSARFEEYRDSAADQLEALAQGARAAGEELGDADTLGVSHYISDMAQSMGSLADGLRGKSADQLLHQAGRLARENPALFLAGSVAVGFGLSRLLRASATADPFDDGDTAHGTTPWRDEDVVPAIAADEDVALTPPHVDDTFGATPTGPGTGTFESSSGNDRLSPDSLNHGNLAKGDLE